MAKLTKLDDIVSLCKRRGFIFQSSEIYGGLASCYDYGPLGVELKNNVKKCWWKQVVQMRDDVVGIDCSILMHPLVWKASGHADQFADLIAECKKCNTRTRVDHLKDKTKIIKILGECVEVNTSDNVSETLRRILTEKGISSYRIIIDGKPIHDITELPTTFAQCKTVELARLVKAGYKDVCVDDIEETRLEQNEGAEEHTEHVALAAAVAGAHDLSKKVCPSCGAVGNFTQPMPFKLMFETNMGANVEDSMSLFLRPETAQGIFANFRNVLDTTRVKIPFGIAQIGKSFRNEVTTKAFIFRTREFEQAELEFFCEPGTDEKWFEHWKEQRFNWYLNLGIKKENLRFREHEKDELAHYAKACVDVEYKFPFGSGDWQELEGIANRTDYDLRQHQRGMRTLNAWYETKGDLSKIQLKEESEDYIKGPLSYFDDEKKTRYIPYVIEPSAGMDRSTLAFLVDAYDEEEVRGETRNLLRFSPAIAPTKVGIFPLVNRDGMPEIARNIYNDLKGHFTCFYDEKGAIGRRYRRQDEAGTPFCITVDGQTTQDKTVTIRERDSMNQIRLATDQLKAYLRDKLDM
jgi:glycyl-tRNA synthetase